MSRMTVRATGGRMLDRWRDRWLMGAALALFMISISLGFISKAAPVQDKGVVQGDGTTRVPVVFLGGHETDPRDGGRPVVLIAAALGVPTEVFREAFRNVRPAPAGTEPSREQVRRNKAALLTALRRYGVTNERLDEVSNYYRYNPGRGELWPTKPATAYAVVKNQNLTGFVITDGGSGYSSPPSITVPGFPQKPGTKASPLQLQLSFSRDFERNGAISGILVTRGK